MEQNGTEKIPQKSLQKYYCEMCDYNTSSSKDYNKHLTTRKHKMKQYEIKNSPKIPFNKYNCNCGKTILSKTTQWRHIQSCGDMMYDNNISCESDNEPPTITSEKATDLVTFLIQENKEFKQMLIEQNKTMMDMMSKQQQPIHCNNNTQINNTQINKQKFNLNFFLNETCKDAMNITDFVNSLQIQFSDIEKVGELGYAEGISRIFMKGLKELDICKRPVHCTDLKREIMHIKNNNKWEKEISLLQKAIKIITNNNINKITDWKNAHPGCTDGENKLNDTYCKIMYESMGPIDEEQEQRDFNKIIRNIAKCTVIDKVNKEGDCEI